MIHLADAGRNSAREGCTNSCFFGFFASHDMVVQWCEIGGQFYHLNSEFPHGPHRYPRDGPEVVRGDNGTLLGAANTRHTL